ncbi:MAG: CoB--CoM heterodisulfide reductase iron-sulfur subunit A family protein [Anaerolineae bacterium]|nr:CoB--CoM heterodisulfide reductase iron-sulfur subunit A family protein [Anaerolineae bacterium]
MTQNEETRVGVFVCHCGSNIAGYVDVAAVTAYARTLPGVVFAQDNMYTCSDGGLTEIKTAIKTHALERVVVAACTPRTHEPLFRDACREAGLNPYLFEFVNIRDQCSWVHRLEPEAATQKAKDLVRMGVAKARLLQPLEEQEMPVEPVALIVGGGMIGMTAAVNLASRGFQVKLVEREPELGGMMLRLDKLYPTQDDAQPLIQQRVAEVRRSKTIEVFTASTLHAIKGFVGNYDVTVRDREGRLSSFKAGTVIVATGARVFTPHGMYGYDGERVVTQLELEKQIADRRLQIANCNLQPAVSNLKRVVMIQCVGARIPERPYCSRICCTTAIKNALELRELNPETEVYILYRDTETQGTRYEAYYTRAREAGIQFIRYSLDHPPQVGEGRVVVYDELLGAKLGIPYDLVVLSTPLVAQEGAHELAQMLKVPLDEHGFFLEAHVKLRPLDFATDGVYVAGTCRWPSHLEETIAQAYGAAARAATILTKEHVTSSGVVARVDESLCRGCGRCVEVCEFGAPALVEVAPGIKVARVNPVMCKGCGACASVCPTGAMAALHFTDGQVMAMVRAALLNQK